MTVQSINTIATNQKLQDPPWLNALRDAAKIRYAGNTEASLSPDAWQEFIQSVTNDHIEGRLFNTASASSAISGSKRIVLGDQANDYKYINDEISKIEGYTFERNQEFMQKKLKDLEKKMFEIGNEILNIYTITNNMRDDEAYYCLKGTELLSLLMQGENTPEHPYIPPTGK